MLLQCTLADALLSLSLETELMMAHWHDCCLAVNLWFMICSKDFTVLVFINPEMAWDQPIWQPGSHQRQQCHSCNQ